MGPQRIAAVVLNSVSHDARVLKEADSLQRAGYEVTLFGIQDNREAEPLTIRDSGVRIVRCEWKRLGHTLGARLILVAGLLCTGMALLIFFAARNQFRTLVMSAAFMETAIVTLIALMAIAFVVAYLRERSLARSWMARPRGGGGALSPLARAKSILLGAVRVPIAKTKTAVMRHAMKVELVNAISAFQPHAVHCHDLGTMPIGDACRRRLGVPVVFDSHELYEEQAMSSPWQKRIYRRRQRFYAGRIDAFITINDSIAGYLRDRYPSLPTPVIVKNATLAPARRVVDDGRLHLAAHLRSEQKILLYQGGFAQHRGLDALVRAGALLPDDWCLVMMGWGKMEQFLRALAREVDPEGRRIRFVRAAPQHELAEWTAGGTLGIIPYENVCLNHWFCTPNKLWEYPVAGVPILASPFPELSMTVRQNDIGLLLSDPVTPENIAAVIGSVTADRLAQMKANCIAYIERDNWSVYEQRLIALYAGLLNASRKTPRREARESIASTTVTEPKISAVPATIQSTNHSPAAGLNK